MAVDGGRVSGWLGQGHMPTLGRMAEEEPNPTVLEWVFQGKDGRRLEGLGTHRTSGFAFVKGQTDKDGGPNSTHQTEKSE